MNVRDYIFKKGFLPEGGMQFKFKFPNGFGASVVSSPYSYGGKDGLFELAVLKFRGDDYDLTYDTKITDDVLGWLTEEEVNKNLIDIFNLEPNHYFDWEKEVYHAD